MNDLVFHPVLPMGWLSFWVTAVAVLFGWSLFRGVRSRGRAALLAVFRQVALAVLTVMLLQPQKRQEEVTVQRPQLAVLIDSSESMADPVDKRQPLRAAKVAEWLKTPALAAARRDFDLRFFTFDQGVAEQTRKGAPVSSNGAVSNVVDSVARVRERFRGQPLAGILLLSDGLDTAGNGGSASTLPTEAGTPKIPVFTFELEKPFKPQRPPRRVSFASVDYPPRAVTGWDTEIRASVAGRGMSGRTVPVELWREGVKMAESALAFNEDDQTRPLAFPVSHATPGTVHYGLRIPDPAADKEAKSYPFAIEVLEPGNRVLYLQNTLGFDFKFLRKAIVTDRNLQLSAFVRWADGQFVALADAGAKSPTATLDLSPRALANNAVVILGDLPPDALSAADGQALRDFVDRGGGLVLLGGPHLAASPASAAMAELLPVKTPAEYREGSFPMQITATGLHHPVFGSLFAEVKAFPPLLTCNLAAGVAPAAEVLMETAVGGKPFPVIVARRFGQGRVVVVLSDTLWRWRLAAGGWSAERSPYDTFWSQLMDWLIPKEQEKQNNNRLELFTERPSYFLGEHPEVRAILRTASPGDKQPATLPLQLRTPDGRAFEYTLRPALLQGRSGKPVAGYRAEVEPNLPGLFQAKSALTFGGTAIEGETRFAVSQPATELTGKPIDRELLTHLAEANGGRFYPMERWGNWRRDLHAKESHFSRVELIDLWNHPWLLGFLLVMLAADWTARKCWNLP